MKMQVQRAGAGTDGGNDRDAAGLIIIFAAVVVHYLRITWGRRKSLSWALACTNCTNCINSWRHGPSCILYPASCILHPASCVQHDADFTWESHPDVAVRHHDDYDSLHILLLLLGLCPRHLSPRCTEIETPASSPLTCKRSSHAPFPVAMVRYLSIGRGLVLR